jgi:hypothetical protein
MSICGPLGFYNTSSTRTHVRFGFSTHAAAGANVAPNSAFEAADLRIYKATDGAAISATQRSSANGVTMTSPFDSLTGVHSVDIDLTDNTDSGFYASGCYYEVWLCPDETVDSQTITGICLCSFEIGVAKADVTQFGGTAGTFNSGIPDARLASGVTHGNATAVLSLNTLTTAGTATLNALTVTNATTLSGAVSMGSTLTVTGATSLAAFSTSGTATLNALTVTNATTLSGAVSATHASNDIRGIDVAKIGTSSSAVTNMIVVFATDFATNYNTTLDAWNVNAAYIDGVAPTDPITGTSDSGTTTTMVDAARTEADDDYWKGSYILFTSGTLAGQCRLITGFTASTDTITFAPATTQAVSTHTYEIIPAARVDVHSIAGTAQTALDVGAIKTKTDFLPSATAGAAGGLFIAGSNAATTAASLTVSGTTTLTGAVSLGSTLTVTGAVTATNASNDVRGVALTTAYDFAKGTVAVTESYAADGAAPTPVQALMLIQQAVTEFSIVGTTVTWKKLDGSTTAGTGTLNDATNPTAITRAT